MPLNKWRAFRRSLLAALDAALPLQHRPTREVVLRQLGEYRLEIHLPVAQRTKPPRSADPRLITAINTLPARRTKLRILYVKHLDPLVAQVDKFQIIQLLQHKMTRVVKQIASPMI